MISAELLRRYPFFATIQESYLHEIAMISEEIQVDKGDIILEEGQQAEYLFIIIKGGIDLLYESEQEFHPKTKKTFLVGQINLGEVFGISAVIEPHISTATATASSNTELIRIDAPKLHKLMIELDDLGCIIMRQVAKIATERLMFTRIQLAAAWAH